MCALTSYVEHANMEIDVEMTTQVPLVTLAVDQTWTSSNNRAAVPYTIETMAADVTPLKDKPLWPLSSYGPSKHEPVVIGGLDESPEELRLRAVTALKSGTSDEYAKYEGERTAAANLVYTNARNNVRQLYEQALKSSTQVSASASTPSPSGPALTTSTQPDFGTSSASSAFGATVTAFGKPAFGQPAFGQTGFGGSAGTTPLFNQGTQGMTAFGGTPQPISAFGQSTQTTPTFTQPTQTIPAFGPSTQPTSVFGQPTSAFARPAAQPTSVFGQSSQPTSAFGQPSQPTSAFGQPSQLTSAFVQPSQTTSAFSQPPQPAFGQSSLIKPASGGFSAFASQPSTFTAATTPSGSASGTTSGQSVFGSTPPVQSAFGMASSTPKSAFGASQPSPPGASFNTLTVPTMLSLPSALGGSSVSSPMTVTPSSEKPASGTPDFASAKTAARMKPGADRYLDLLPSNYIEMMPTDVMTAFTGSRFEWGKIPDWIPPAEVR